MLTLTLLCANYFIWCQNCYWTFRRASRRPSYFIDLRRQAKMRTSCCNLPSRKMNVAPAAILYLTRASGFNLVFREIAPTCVEVRMFTLRSGLISAFLMLYSLPRRKGHIFRLPFFFGATAIIYYKQSTVALPKKKSSLNF